MTDGKFGMVIKTNYRIVAENAMRGAAEVIAEIDQLREENNRLRRENADLRAKDGGARHPGPVERAIRDEFSKPWHGKFWTVASVDQWFNRTCERLEIEHDPDQCHLVDLIGALLDELDDPKTKAEESRKVTEDDLPEELRKRLMPVGMEWPRFEDGEPVSPGDLANCGCSTPIEVDGFELTVCNGGELYWSVEGMRDDHGTPQREWIRPEPGERVKRPKRPDVAENHENPPKPATEGDGISLRGRQADSPTVDGDSWEQWFEDYDIPSSVDYCDKRGIHLNSIAFCFSARDSDLKRRAKKLAGVEE